MKCVRFFENIDLIEVVLATIRVDLDRSGGLTLYMHSNIEFNTKLAAIDPPDVKCMSMR